MEMCPQKDGNISVDMDDDVIRGATVVHRGEITWPPPPIAVGAERKPSFGGQAISPEQEAAPEVAPQTPTVRRWSRVSATASGFRWFWVDLPC